MTEAKLKQFDLEVGTDIEEGDELTPLSGQALDAVSGGACVVWAQRVTVIKSPNP